jgi:hypothetical protein
VVPVPPPPLVPVGALVPPVVPVGAAVVPVEPPPVGVVAAPELPVVLVEPELVELDEVVEVVLFAAATEPLGTVNAGAPEVSVDPEPPPQAATPSTSTIAAMIPIADLGLRAGWLICSPRDLRSRAAPFAARNVGSR